MRATPPRRRRPATPGMVAGLLASVALVGPPPGVAAQGGPLPAGWVVRPLDAGPSPGGVEFVDMPPGWHINTGAAVLLFDPEVATRDRFRVEMEVYLFDPGSRREAFGFFTGGRGLDGDARSYTFFLIREGGEYLVGRRDGATTQTLAGWTRDPSIHSFADAMEGETSVKNVLVLDVDDDEVRFRVNDREVASLPRAALDLDGIVGLRVDGGLSLHVSRLEVIGRDPAPEASPPPRAPPR